MKDNALKNENDDWNMLDHMFDHDISEINIHMDPHDYKTSKTVILALSEYLVSCGAMTK